MNRFDFYQRHYFHEFERKDHLLDALSVPLGILSLLVGGFAYYLVGFQYGGTFDTILFVICLAVAAVLITVIVAFLVRSYWNFTYHFISDTQEVHEFDDANITYWKSRSPKSFQRKADGELQEMLVRKYSRAATLNAANNDRRSANLHRANTATICLVVVFFLTSPVYFWNSFTNRKPAQQTMPGMLMSKDDDSKKPAKPTEAEKKPEKPKEPPDKMLREFDERRTRDTKELND